MGIQRWTPPGSEIDLAENGDFVLFTDHEQVVAELTKAHQDNLDSWLHQREEITRLRAELAAKSKDAERYAWLRERAGQDDDFVQIFIDNESYAPGHLDAQIDYAMGDGDE